jgi:hypothetical protein
MAARSGAEAPGHGAAIGRFCAPVVVRGGRQRPQLRDAELDPPTAGILRAPHVEAIARSQSSRSRLRSAATVATPPGMLARPVWTRSTQRMARKRETRKTPATSFRRDTHSGRRTSSLARRARGSKRAARQPAPSLRRALRPTASSPRRSQSGPPAPLLLRGRIAVLPIAPIRSHRLRRLPAPR